jgi:hypothetical protein
MMLIAMTCLGDVEPLRQLPHPMLLAVNCECDAQIVHCTQGSAARKVIAVFVIFGTIAVSCGCWHPDALHHIV